MNPREFWDAYAQKFGQDVALEKLGPRPEGEAPSVAGGVARSLLQGGTFGRSEEAFARLRGPRDRMGRPQEEPASPQPEIDRERAGMEQFRGEHKVLAPAAEFAGGVASGAGTGKLLGTASKGASASARALRNILEGAGGGALAGAGTAEEGERVGGAIRGAGFGAGVAGGVGAFAGMGKWAGARALDALNLRPASAPSGPVGRAAEAMRVRPESHDDRAKGELLDWMKMDQDTPETVQARGATRTGPTALADVGGPNLQRLVGTIESKPGTGSKTIRETLTERQGQSPQRIDAAIRQQVGQDVGDLGGVMNARSAAQRAEGNRLYGIAKNAGDLNSPELVQLLGSDRPALRAAIEMVQGNYANAGQAMPPLDGSAPIPLQVVDDIKGALDHMAKWGSDGATRQSRASQGSVRGVIDELFGVVDPIAPDYPRARGAWSAAEGAKEAFEEGYQSFKTMEPEALARRMTEPGADDFRLGAARYLRELGGGATDRPGSHNLPARIMGSGDRRLWAPGSEAKIRALFGDADPDEFLRAMESEGAMHGTFSQMTGSRTTPLANAGQRLEEGLNAAGDAAGLAKGDVSAVPRLARWASQSRAAGFNEGTMSRMADMLTAGAKNPQDRDQVIELLRLYAEQQAQRQAAGSPLVRGAATAAGLSAGRSGP